MSGEDAPIDELVDFIVAAQIAQRFEKDTDDTTHNYEDKNEVLCEFKLCNHSIYLLNRCHTISYFRVIHPERNS